MQEDSKLGVQGSYGINDGGYIHARVCSCAKELKKAQEIFSQGHYAHSNAKVISENHPLRIAMEQLSILDKHYAEFANKLADEDLFSTYEPLEEDVTRWDKAVAGVNGEDLTKD
jgi:hypothetical protein